MLRHRDCNPRVTRRWELDGAKVVGGEAWVGWAGGGGGAIVEGQVNYVHRRKTRLPPMHDALVALLLMAIVMFPCFLSMETPS